MIAVVYGTTGELIKLAPLLATLEGRGQPAFTLTTAQQVQQIPDSLRDFGLRQPDLWLRDRSTRDLEHRGQIARWLSDVVLSFAQSHHDMRHRLRGERSLLIVHGDTMTTLLGSLMGRTYRVPVGHIEAGMRSGDWRDPFPEEVIRRVTSQVVNVHFAPGPKPVANLRRARVHGTIVDTGENTIRDSLELAATTAHDAQIPAEPYGLVSLHRFELLERPDRLRAILEVLSDAARRSRMLFVDHPVTADAIRSNGLEPLFHDGFVRIPRRRYSGFVALVRRSRFLVTDSGGSQEECAYLGVPCLVHRGVTEHDTGLDGSVVLSRFDLDLVRRFLENPDRWRTEPRLPERSPTAVIVDFLESERLIAPA